MANVVLVEVSWLHDLVREFMFSQQVDESTEDHYWYGERGDLLGRQIWHVQGRCYTGDELSPTPPEVEAVILRMIELYNELETSTRTDDDA